jgi:hypothetical protein
MVSGRQDLNRLGGALLKRSDISVHGALEAHAPGSGHPDYDYCLGTPQET